MYGKTRNKKVQKLNKTKNSKRGFTLVELTIVMALVVIVSGITVSFSVMMKDLTAENRDEYEFMEHHSTLKEELCNWVAENDVAGSKFTVNTDETLTVTLEDGTEKTVRFSNGTLRLGDKRITELDEIDQIYFEIDENKKLIRCETNHKNKDGDTSVTNSFVFSLRFGEMVEEGGIL